MAIERVDAIGDALLVEEELTLSLCGARGVARTWERLRDAMEADTGSFSDHVSRATGRATPPRLAMVSCEGRYGGWNEEPRVRVESRTFAWLDAATGDVHARAPTSIDFLLGVSPAGDVAYASDANDSALVFVDDTARISRRFDEVTRPTALHANPAGSTLLVRRGYGASATLVRIDVVSGRVFALAPHGSLVSTALIANPALTFCATIERRDDGVVEVVVRDVASGAVVSAVASDPVYIAANPAFDRLCTIGSDGIVCVFTVHGTTAAARLATAPRATMTLTKTAQIVSGPLPRIDVDVDGDRIVCFDERRNAVSVWTLGGAVLHSVEIPRGTDAGRACAAITPGGVVLIGPHGALTVVDGDGRPSLVPAPAALVAVAKHPRGVVVLDRGGRTHVVDL